MNKKTTTVLLIIILLLFSQNIVFASEIGIVINGKEISTSSQAEKPTNINGRIYVPLRLLVENMDKRIDWDNINKQVLLDCSPETRDNPPQNPGKKIRIIANDRVIETNQETGTPYISENNKVMVPIRLSAEVLMSNVSWDNKKVIISRIITEQPSRSENNQDREKVNQIEGGLAFINNLSILGENIATREQIIKFMENEEERFRTAAVNQNREFLRFPLELVDMYLEIGKEYNIRGDIAFFQAVHETGFFQFTGIVKPQQNNFCGLWATGVALTGNEPFNGVSPDVVAFIPGVHGLTYFTQRDGVEAHIQHLYAYATTEPLPAGKVLVNPRFSYPRFAGIAVKWTDLNGRWAVPGVGYGETILNYWAKSLDF